MERSFLIGTAFLLGFDGFVVSFVGKSSGKKHCKSDEVNP
jgi:hypothetical protein